MTNFLKCKHNEVDGYTQICSACGHNIWETKAEYLAGGDSLKQKYYENQEKLIEEMNERDKPWNTDGW